MRAVWERLIGGASILCFLTLYCGCNEPGGTTPSPTAPARVSSVPPSNTVVPHEEPALAEKEISLSSCGVKLDRSQDGQVKSVDFTGATIPDRARFGDDDLATLSTARVVRGKGTVPHAVLAASARMDRLTEFLWNDASVDSEEFGKILALKELKKIRLTGLKSESRGKILKMLAAAPALVDLDISGSGMNDSELSDAFAGEGFAKLVRLNLYQTETSDAGVQAISSLARQLLWLNLDATAITDAACPTLAKFSSLTFLHLGRTSITDAAVDSIGAIKTLKTLHVTRTKLTEKGFQSLKEKLPGCKVVTVVETPPGK